MPKLRALILSTSLSALLLCACADDHPEWEAGFCAAHPHDRNCYEPGDVVAVALATHLVRPDEMQDACAMFSVKEIGLSCVLVPQEYADVIVVDSDVVCPAADANTRVLAYAFPGGWIEIYRRCYPTMNRAARVVALAHELGHQLGMEHVPVKCDAEGMQPICGKAVLNEFNRADVFALTPADIAAYGMRTAAMHEIGRGADLPPVPTASAQ